MGEPLSEAHQLLLNTFWAKHYFTNDELHGVFAKITADYPDNYFVKQINDSIESLSFEIKKARTEDNEIVWTIVNTKKDKLMEIATPLAPVQLKLVKFLVDFLAEDPSIDSKRVVNEAHSNLEKKHSINEIQASLELLAEDGWLNTTENGKIEFSPKALLELKPYFS